MIVIAAVLWLAVELGRAPIRTIKAVWRNIRRAGK
jgi:hypothetical protein